MADAILTKADKANKNGKLTRGEVMGFGTTLADREEKMFVDWLVNSRCLFT